MKLAVEIHWMTRRFSIPVERIRLAERLGYDVVFTAEAHGSDALTPLGFVLGITDRIGVGTHIANMYARSPTATAMAFQTLSAMGKHKREIVAGIGVSNVTTAEAWHGRPWTSPLALTRDYVAIMRSAFQGDAPISHRGRAVSVPLEQDGVTDGPPPMAPLMETNPNIPIVVGSGAEAMITLTAEIADGWTPMGFAPGMMSVYKPMLEAGFKRAKTPKSLDNFAIWACIDVIVSDDVEAAMKPFKEFTARYVSGISASPRAKNIYKNQMIWCGYEAEQKRVEELWRAGHHREAAEAVPDAYIDNRFLFGPVARIKERAKRWRDAGATGYIIRPEQNPDAADQLEIYEIVARALRG